MANCKGIWFAFSFHCNDSEATEIPVCSISLIDLKEWPLMNSLAWRALNSEDGLRACSFIPDDVLYWLYLSIVCHFVVDFHRYVNNVEDAGRSLYWIALLGRGLRKNFVKTCLKCSNSLQGDAAIPSAIYNICINQMVQLNATNTVRFEEVIVSRC